MLRRPLRKLPRHFQTGQLRPDGIVVYALLLDKSALGIYMSYTKAEQAWDVFLNEQRPASRLYQFRPFELITPIFRFRTLEDATVVSGFCAVVQ